MRKRAGFGMIGLLITVVIILLLMYFFMSSTDFSDLSPAGETKTPAQELLK